MPTIHPAPDKTVNQLPILDPNDKPTLATLYAGIFARMPSLSRRFDAISWNAQALYNHLFSPASDPDNTFQGAILTMLAGVWAWNVTTWVNYSIVPRLFLLRLPPSLHFLINSLTFRLPFLILGKCPPHTSSQHLGLTYPLSFWLQLSSWALSSPFSTTTWTPISRIYKPPKPLTLALSLSSLVRAHTPLLRQCYTPTSSLLSPLPQMRITLRCMSLLTSSTACPPPLTGTHCSSLSSPPAIRREPPPPLRAYASSSNHQGLWSYSPRKNLVNPDILLHLPPYAAFPTPDVPMTDASASTSPSAAASPAQPSVRSSSLEKSRKVIT